MVKKVSKKTKTTSGKSKSPSKKSKSTSRKTKKNSAVVDDLDIIFVDEEVSVDKESELEARKAYLEEARSQESSSD